MRYRVATARGLTLGIVNEENAVRRADPVIVKYMPSKFGELWQHPHVVATLRVMLHEGEISMKTTAHAEDF
ncbi:hypothetical protein [Paraburkholderia strydomiana]|uniref:hypothetical protein n=1 Tax=Paraburkholderia strydomiana TaxID=1245417 RepID=UPI0038B8E0EA